MRKLTKIEKELWDKVCASINNDRSRIRLNTYNKIHHPAVYSSIDLHGYSEDSAYMAVSQMIATNYQNGSKEITIITGKGRNSVGILRRLVPYWLDTTLSHYVRSYNFDPKNAGQLIVMLKKEKSVRVKP
jgi:DNA-nicking Smr family endonuclease